MEQQAGAARELRFELNRVYDRWSDIHEPFGGSKQSGISPSRKALAVFLFTGDTGEQYGYKDHFDRSGVFHYTGEGQLGDMTMTKGNLAIARHAQDGRALHVFRALGKGKGQEYVGEFAYVSHTYQPSRDREGHPRQSIVFHLVPVRTVDDNAATPPGVADIDRKPPESLHEARERALAAITPQQGVGGLDALRSIYERSHAVRDYVLMRAAGSCECCKEPAPFARPDGTPYLEVHHTTRLSDGGLDHPAHVAGVCPSCHREVHYGADGWLKNRDLQLRIQAMEDHSGSRARGLAGPA